MKFMSAIQPPRTGSEAGRKEAQVGIVTCRLSNLNTLKWCGRGDLNPHALRRHPLKMVCLPIPPLPQEASTKRLEEGRETGGRPDPPGVNTRSSVIVRMELAPPPAVQFLLAKRPLEPERCSEDYSALFHPWEPE